MSEVYRILAHANHRIGVRYDSRKQPYFEVIVSEALSEIASKPIGRQLLDEIGRCTPGVLFDWWDSEGENVRVMPTFEKSLFKVRGIPGRNEYITEVFDIPFQAREDRRRGWS